MNVVIHPLATRALEASLAPTEASASAGPSAGAREASGPGSFESVLGGALQAANQADRTAAQKSAALASGAIDDLHGTMISVKEADIAVRLVGSVRNKILDAFQELWRTSV